MFINLKCLKLKCPNLGYACTTQETENLPVIPKHSEADDFPVYTTCFFLICGEGETDNL